MHLTNLVCCTGTLFCGLHGIQRHLSQQAKQVTHSTQFCNGLVFFSSVQASLARAVIRLMSFWLMRLLFNAFLSGAFSQPNLISVHFVRIKLDFYRHLIRLLNITNTKT